MPHKTKIIDSYTVFIMYKKYFIKNMQYFFIIEKNEKWLKLY